LTLWCSKRSCSSAAVRSLDDRAAFRSPPMGTHCLFKIFDRSNAKRGVSVYSFLIWTTADVVPSRQVCFLLLFSHYLE
jgi:hypothetical protein